MSILKGIENSYSCIEKAMNNCSAKYLGLKKILGYFFSCDAKHFCTTTLIISTKIFLTSKEIF
jgi:hypothetical protein